jgi:5'-nucleotidase
METNRRTFLRRAALASVAISGVVPMAGAMDLFGNNESFVVTILHTNDVHSQIDPLPSNHSRYPNMGGFARRASIVAQARQQNPNTLLFDCGDIFQGTPYFNFYKGKLEIALMNKMGYDASAIGNHEFDNGIDELAKRMGEANFPFLASNYVTQGTTIADFVKPYKIFDVNGVKIGVVGVGIELEGLAHAESAKAIGFLNPIDKANEQANWLKTEGGCKFVVVLSHLGLSYSDDQFSDVVLAKNSSNIDLILGGHTHTFLSEPLMVSNLEGRQVMVNQMGWAGVRLGRIDVEFTKNPLAAVSLKAQSYEV